MNHAGEIDAFATACVARLPLRLRVTDERSGQSEEVTVNRPLAIIGSSELCDVRLVHPDVSRHHAYIQLLEGRPLCCDLGSRTGTHWGTAIRSRSWMLLGEPMYIGPFSVRLVDNEQVDPPSDEMPVTLAVDRPLRAPQPNMLLTFLNARSRSGRTRISRVRNPITLVGWSHLCNLRLQHHSVGRVHCSLVWTPTGLWAVDLLCQGGTRINGELVNFARLDDEDDLTLGRFQLKIAYGSSAEMPIFSPSDLPEASPIADLPRLVPPGKFKQGRLPAPKDKTEKEPNPSTELSVSEPGTGSDELPPELSQRLAGDPPQELRRPLPSMPMPMPTAQFVSPAQFGTPAQLGEGMPINEAMAVSLMQQFATMQQQLFDHTHQLLAVMAETFQSAHTRQMQLIREELQRVHELNRELHDLSRQKGAEEAGPAAMAAASGEQAVLLAVEELRQQTAEEPVTLDGDEPLTVETVATRTPPSVREKAPAPPAASEFAPATSPTERAAPPGADQEKKAAAAGGDRTSAPAQKPRVPVESAQGPEGKDMHAWLSGRINDLERERSSRWQRILQLLTQGSG